MTTTTGRTLRGLAADVRITSTLRDMTAQERTDRDIDAKRSGFRDDDMTYWTVQLRYRGRQMTTPYMMGSALTGEPSAEDVLASLLLDASHYDNARSFEDWCGEYGYDDDSRRAERTYNAVQRLTEKVKALLGSEYRAFMDAAADW